jgi:hypothetical protein
MGTYGLFAVIAASFFMMSVAPAQSVQSYEREGLNTRGLAKSEIYQRIYYGHFARLRSRHRFEVEHFKYLFVHSAMAYGIKCPDALAADSPTVAITAADVDGWGNKFNYQTRHYTIDTRFYEKASEYGVPFNFGYGGELLLLFQQNDCVSQEIIQYLENLLRFAYNQPSVQEKAPAPVKRYKTMGKVDPHPAEVLAKLRILRRPE